MKSIGNGAKLLFRVSDPGGRFRQLFKVAWETWNWRWRNGMVLWDGDCGRWGVRR